MKAANLLFTAVGCILVGAYAVDVPNSGIGFAFLAVLPLLICLPVVLIDKREAHLWVTLPLILAATFASWHEYRLLATGLSPLAPLALWMVPLLLSALVVVLLPFGLFLTNYFQLRRGEV